MHATLVAEGFPSNLMQAGVLGVCIFNVDGRVHQLMGQAEWAPKPGCLLDEAPLFVGLGEALQRVAQDGAPLHLPAVRIGARGCDFRVLRLPNSPYLAVFSLEADGRLELLRAAKQTERRQRILDEHAWIERDQHRAARADLLNQFIERSPAAVAVIDRDLIEIVASERWRALYALQDNGAAQQDGVFSESERAQFLRMSIDNGVPSSRVEKTMRDGAPVWTRWEQVPWRETDGAIAGAFVYSEDVTEPMLRLERLKAETVRLAKAAADLRALIRGAVKRLRPILLGEEVQAGAGALQKGRGEGGLSTAQVRALRDVTQALARFESLFGPDPTMVPVDLGALVEGVALELADDLHHAGAQIALKPMLAVLGDHALLRRVFAEIIGNALRHGGESPHMVIDCIEDDSGIVVRVTDDGVGLAGPLRARALDFFERIERPSGAGMGLPECRRIMELHGGVLALDPDWDAGLRVALTFPRSKTGPSPCYSQDRVVGFP
jgi:signal transduction histidine kinase